MMIRTNGGDWQLFVSAPADAVLYASEDNTVKARRLSPFKVHDNAGCNIPGEVTPLSVTEDIKPLSGYDYWSLDDVAGWLSGDKSNSPRHHIGKLLKDARVHVRIDPTTGASAEGQLFATVSLCLPDIPLDGKAGYSVALLGRVQGDVHTDRAAPAFLPLGGERRAAALNKADGLWPVCPPELRQTLEGKTRLKLQLVTPTLFTNGWKPGWADAGKAPMLNTGAELVSAAVQRRIAVSGWDYEKKQPKAARYAGPAGSVYFLELSKPLTGEMIDRLWLCSVCDDEQDNRDGFGIAVPGTWDYSVEEAI